MASSNARAPMVITHQGGLRFVADVGNHRLLVDQPESAGGQNAGPAPLQLLGAALGTCVALYVQQFCDARDLPVEGMRVEVQQRGARNPARIDSFEVRVVLPGTIPARYGEMLERVARSCPAHNTLAAGADVKVEIEAGAPAIPAAPAV